MRSLPSLDGGRDMWLLRLTGEVVALSRRKCQFEPGRSYDIIEKEGDVIWMLIIIIIMIWDDPR